MHEGGAHVVVAMGSPVPVVPVPVMIVPVVIVPMLVRAVMLMVIVAVMMLMAMTVFIDLPAAEQPGAGDVDHQADHGDRDRLVETDGTDEAAASTAS